MNIIWIYGFQAYRPEFQGFSIVHLRCDLFDLSVQWLWNNIFQLMFGFRRWLRSIRAWFRCSVGSNFQHKKKVSKLQGMRHWVGQSHNNSDIMRYPLSSVFPRYQWASATWRRNFSVLTELENWQMQSARCNLGSRKTHWEIREDSERTNAFQAHANHFLCEYSRLRRRMDLRFGKDQWKWTFLFQERTFSVSCLKSFAEKKGPACDIFSWFFHVSPSQRW